LRVSPTPLLMLVANHDTTSLTGLALQVYERALEPKRLVMIEGGHFDAYLGGAGSRRPPPPPSTGSRPTFNGAPLGLWVKFIAAGR
jgi:hypothetical protein